MLKRVSRACELATMAAVLFVGTARAQQMPQASDARALFEAGVNYLQEKPEPRYEEALKLFRASYAQSGNFRALLAMGVCELHLERDGDAISHFKQYLSQGGNQVPPELRSQAERDIATLNASLVHVTLDVRPVGATIVDERTPVQDPVVVNRYFASQPTLMLGVRPGHHKITVTSDERLPEAWTFDVDPGASLFRRFELKLKPSAAMSSLRATAAESPSSPKGAAPQDDHVPLGMYIGAAGIGVLLAGAVVSGLLAHEKNSEYQDLNDAEHEAEARERRDEAGRLLLASDILLVGAVVTGGLTAYFHFTRNSGSTTTGDVAGSAERDQLALCVLPEVGLKSGGLVVSGEF